MGLLVIPLGAWLGWRWVRVRWWRLLHLVSWAVVALQAVLGRACFLTLMQADAAGPPGERAPLIARWVNGLLYWPLPLWAFAAAYVALFALVLWFWRAIAPDRAFFPSRG